MKFLEHTEARTVFSVEGLGKVRVPMKGGRNVCCKILQVEDRTECVLFFG